MTTQPPNIPVSELEEFLSKHVSRKPADSEKSIVISSAERRRLEQLIGKNMTTGADLIRAVEHALAVSMDGLTIELSPFLLDRLHSRCIGMTFDKFMTMLIKRELEEYSGLR